MYREKIMEELALLKAQWYTYLRKYSATEPRDERGRWTDSGGGAAAEASEAAAPAQAAGGLDLLAADATIHDWIYSPGCKTTLKRKNYDKHVPETAAYEKYLAERRAAGMVAQSRLTISYEEAQQIILKRRGTGELKRVRFGEWLKQEKISCGRIIGICVDKNGNEHETSNATLHYSKKDGIHIVPR